MALIVMSTLTNGYAQHISKIQELLRIAKEQRIEDNYIQAYAYTDSALQLSYQTDDQNLIAKCISEVGIAAMYLGRYTDALEAFHKGIQIRESLADSIGMQESYNYIATVHHAQSNHDLAAQYYKLSMRIAESRKDQRKLAVLHNNLGDLFKDKGDYQTAIDNHNISLEIWKTMKDTAWQSVSLRHIGNCYENQGDLYKALAAYEKSLFLSEKAGSNRNIVRASVALGTINLKLGNYGAAEAWCSESFEVAQEHGISMAVQESSDCLANAHEKMGNYPKALSFFRLSEKLKDSIYSNEKMKELTQLELSYQFERQQYRDSLEFVKATLVQDKRISNQRIGLISIGFITFILATLALMIYTGKRKSDSLLLNILPEKVADELKRTGKSKATKFEGVTVIFTDFKGFTEMTEMLSAEDLVSEINLCFSEFDAIMSKYGIEKIKTIGDAYMAASGLPIPDPDHAIKAVDAAIEMVDFIAKRKSSLESLNKPAFEMRVGLNTGHVIAGIVGTKKFQYDIWGDTVNIASRMESGGEPGKVNISESTYTLVKERFKCIPRGKIKAKGKGEMEMYFVE